MLSRGTYAVGKRSKADILVLVEGVDDGDPRLIGPDWRAAVPAHLCQRVIGFQDDERISDIGQEGDGFHWLQAKGTNMKEALEGGPIKRRAKNFLADVGRAIKLHRHNLFAPVRMWLDVVAVPVPVDHRLRYQLQIVGAGRPVAARTNFESVM